jgi:hypothetical protein
MSRLDLHEGRAVFYYSAKNSGFFLTTTIRPREYFVLGKSAKTFRIGQHHEGEGEARIKDRQCAAC